MPGEAYHPSPYPMTHEPYLELPLRVFENAQLAARAYHTTFVVSGLEARARDVSEARRWLEEVGPEYMRALARVSPELAAPSGARYERWLISQRRWWLADVRTAGCGRHNPYDRDQPLRCVPGCSACRQARQVARLARDLDWEVERERARRARRVA